MDRRDGDVKSVARVRSCHRPVLEQRSGQLLHGVRRVEELNALDCGQSLRCGSRIARTAFFDHKLGSEEPIGPRGRYPPLASNRLPCRDQGV